MHGASGVGPTTHVTSTTRAVGVQVSIPVFTGGLREAKRDEAAALARKAQFDAAALRQEVLRHAHAAWLAVATGIARVRALEQALQSARSRLDATETGREVGARTTLDLMNAQNDFHQARQNLAQARYEFLLNRLSLWAMAGELTDAELVTVNAMLEPAAAGKAGTAY
jgi:outer membrane protein